MRITPIIFISTIILSGCSTTNGKNISCDFVVGAHESSQRDNEPNSSSASKTTTNDKINGVLSVISGAINRSATGSSQDGCEN